MKVFSFLFAGGIILCLQGLCSASPQRSGIDLLSCIGSIDQRLAECGIRGFGIADRDQLQASLERTREYRNAVPARPRTNFWAVVKRFPQFVFRGLRHFFVPKARAFLCMGPEDEESETGSQEARRHGDFYEIDHLWAFERANPDTFDAEARAWQRGHDRLTSVVSLEPDLEKNRYGMSLDVRF